MKNTDCYRSIERYCLDNFDKQKLLLGKSSNIQRPCLNPTDIISFSEQQLQKKAFQRFIINDESEFRWIEGSMLSPEQELFIPAQLVFTSYVNLKSEPCIRYPISTGAAAGTSLENAIYTGICEIVERDAFMISYLNKLKSPIIDLDSIKDKIVDNIISLYNRYRLELVVIDITTDIQIPSFAAITLDRTGLGPAVSVGLKTRFNVLEAVIGAIEESLMTRSWLRDKFIYNVSSHKISKTIKTIEDRAFFWFKPDSIHYLDFWLKNKSIKNMKLNSNLADENEDLNKAIKLLKKS